MPADVKKNASRPTRDDVARLAGVSNATVSNVLHRPDAVPISIETRNRVLKIARKIGYLRNRIAASLVQQSTRMIGVVIPTIKGSFHSAILEGIERELARHDYHVMTAFADDASLVSQQTRVLLEHRVAGLILVGNCSLPQIESWSERALRERMPVILVDQHQSRGTVDCVVSDDYHGALAATEHLLRLGHRRIAHIAGAINYFTSRNRKRGYCAALRNAGLAPDDHLVVGATWDPDLIRPEVVQLLESSSPPTAIFAASDLLAAAALQVAMERGVRVPADLAVVGYGDLEVSQCLALSTVSQNAEEMGRFTAERLLTRLSNPKLKVEEVVLPTQLMIRRSSGLSN